jgi:putative peptidoglycan lipid II flippase
MEKKSNFAVKVVQLIFFAFVAKGFGFVREIVLANYYGTSYVSDVYVAVQNIPAIIFTIFGTAVTTGFIPLYTEVKVKKNKESADIFANNVFNIFLTRIYDLYWNSTCDSCIYCLYLWNVEFTL